MNAAQTQTLQGLLQRLSGHVAASSATAATPALPIAPAVPAAPVAPVQTAPVMALDTLQRSSYGFQMPPWGYFVGGQIGPEVAALQSHLIALGYLAGTPDGVYAYGTIEAVRYFQLEYGLPANGSFDQTAYATMMAVFAGQLPRMRGPGAQPPTPPAEPTQPSQPTEPAQPAPAPPQEPAPPKPTDPGYQTYTVRSGDTLSGIAQATLGDGSRWREIYELNKNAIGSNPNVIIPGTMLKLPEGATVPTAAAPSTPAPTVELNFPLNTDQIAHVLGAPVENVRKYWPEIAKALQKRGITSTNAIIAVLATIKVEVGSFKPIPEYASGQAYEGRKDLGNTQPGDGVRYKGRGFIQLTGRANYETYGKALGVDLVNNPDLALDPKISAEVLAEYFVRRGIPAMADREDWQAVRRAVNGGTNGWNTFIGAVNSLKAAL